MSRGKNCHSAFEVILEGNEREGEADIDDRTGRARLLENSDDDVGVGVSDMFSVALDVADDSSDIPDDADDGVKGDVGKIVKPNPVFGNEDNKGEDVPEEMPVQ